MDTAILAVMISLATLGFATMGLIWRSLDKRMDALQQQIETNRAQIEAVRNGLQQQIEAVRNGLQQQIEAIRVQNEEQHLMIINLLRGHAERIAHLEGHKEALAAAAGELVPTAHSGESDAAHLEPEHQPA